jgi:hypothetical protein
MNDFTKIQTNHSYLVIYFSTTEQKEVWLPCKDKKQLARTLYNLNKNNIKAKAYWKTKEKFLDPSETEYLVYTYKTALTQFLEKNANKTNLFFEQK